MRVYIRIFLLFMSWILSMNVQAQDYIELRGRVADSKTRNDLPGSSVELLSATDSTVIETLVARTERWIDNKQSFVSEFTFKVPRKKASYIIRANFLGYKTTCVNINLGELRKREFEKQLPAVLMRPESTVLDEVNVTGSKVKFYHKGDTVVYNADAFILAEGSMLDALIRQMPGVEIKSDGRIYHNGKYVESLLLNGKDFFKGDQQVMLDMLPTYMVKQVKVYDKYGKRSEFMGEKIANDKEYVMDVNLKKEYSVGYLGNVEAGAGTADRYLGRLLAMRHTDHSQVALYANLNNLNDKRKPGQDSNWSPEQMPRGNSKEVQAGIDYGIADRDGKFQLTGDAQVSHTSSYLETSTDKVNFLPTADNYEYIRSIGRDKSFTLKTKHRLDFMGEWLLLELVPEFSYDHYENNGVSLDGIFSSPQVDMSRQLLERLYSPEVTADIRRDLVYRYSKETLGKGHSLGGRLFGLGQLKFKNSSDYAYVIGEVSGNSKREDLFNRYAIDYTDETLTGGNGYQYFRNRPNDNLRYNAYMGYSYKMSQALTLSFRGGYQRDYRNRHSSLYLLDRLSGYDDKGLGVLPSVAEYETSRDASNSYVSKSWDDTYEIGAEFAWTVKTKKGRWANQGNLYFHPTHQKLDYERGAIDTTIVRNSLQVLAPFWKFGWYSNDNSKVTQLVLSATPKTPDLVNMVDMRDDTDPMNVTIGNPDLKNEYAYKANLLLRGSNKDRQSVRSLRLGYTYVQDALAIGYSYNATTGVRTYRAANVNGNWNATADYSFENPLDKARRLTLRNSTQSHFYNSVDLVGVTSTNGYGAKRNTVKTLLLSEDLSLSYKLEGSSSIGLKGSYTWRHTDGNADSFASFNAWNINYGANAVIQLPCHFQIATDLTMYTRRGYDGSSMNTDDLVWNARLSFTMLKGKLTWMLDGFDILNQLNNVTRVVNAQGRTETYTNVLPRYAILHVAYKFNHKPKK